MTPAIRLDQPLRRLSSLGRLIVAAEIFVTYLQVRWWLRRHDVQQTVARLRGACTGVNPPPGLEQANELRLGLRLGRIVERTLDLLPTDNRCLMRSLVLTALLARRGVGSSLIIGVRSEPRFAAHAWVEHGRWPLLSPGDEAFSRLAYF